MKRQHPTDPNLFWCPKCKTYKARDEFSVRDSFYKSNLQAYCKACDRMRMSIYQKENTDKVIIINNKYRKTANGREKNNQKAKREVQRCSNSYISGMLRAGGARSISPELIEIKRQQIIMKRTLKQLKQWRKENEK